MANPNAALFEFANEEGNGKCSQCTPSALSTQTLLSSDCLNAAYSYARRGWRVLPLEPRGKRPLTRHGVYSATTDLARLRRWWENHPDANVGIATGRASGLVVIDVDGPEGEASLSILEDQYGALPPTTAVLTGKGQHLYFRHPGGKIRCSISLRPGLDVKADGGYIVAPPSLHPSGARYRWLDKSVPVADLPHGLRTLLRARSPKPRGLVKPTSEDVGMGPIREGVRNVTLTRLAGRLRAGGADEATIAAVLTRVNKMRCEPPLRETEVLKIARSIARYPAGENDPTVRIPRALLSKELSAGAVVVYAAHQAMWLTECPGRPREVAKALGVAVRTVYKWTREARNAGWHERVRPTRRYIRVPARLILDPEMPVSAKFIALHVAALTSGEGVAQVGIQALVRRTGLAEKTLRRGLMALAQKGYLLVYRARFNPKKRRRERVNRYKLWPTPIDGTSTAGRRPEGYPAGGGANGPDTAVSAAIEHYGQCTW